jgi:O-antigen ligase
MASAQTSTEAPPRRRLNLRMAAGLGASLLIVLAAVAADRPAYVLLAPAPFVAWLVWRQAAARMAFVVVGGLFVLVSNANHLTATKVVYFAGVALALVSILCRRELYAALRERSTTVRTLAPMTLALGALILISLPVAHAQHTAFSPWLRDAATYGLAAAAPLFIWDFERNASPRLGRLALVLLAVGGVLSGLSLLVQWLGARGVTSTRVSLHVLPGQLLPGALALFLAARAGSAARGRGWYAVGALAIPLALILTGTRSLLSLLVCVVLVLVTRWNEKRPLALWTGAVVVAAALLVAGLVALGNHGHPGVAKLSHRITSIPHTVAHPTSDASYRLRANEWRVSWQAFKAHPVLGVGPGHTFTWSCRSSGCLTGTLSRYDLDSPVTFPAKFGVLGLVALVVVAVSLVAFLRARRRSAPRDGWLAFAWYLVFAVTLLPFGWPVEQKDFALGLLLLGALVVQPALPTFAGLGEDWTALRRRITPDARRPSRFSALPEGYERDLDRVSVLSVRGGIFAAIVALAGAAAVAVGFALADWHRGSAHAGSTASSVAGEAKVLPQSTAFKAQALGDARVWAYWNCSGRCHVSVKPVSNPSTSIWELRVIIAGATSCFLLDTKKFNPARVASERLPNMRC